MDQLQQQAPEIPSQPNPTPSAPPVSNNAPTTPKPLSKNYFVRLYTGRVNRRNYILGLILPTVILVALDFILILIGEHLPYRSSKPQSIAAALPQQSPISIMFGDIFIMFTVACMLYIIIYMFSLPVRRLHDLNKTGWLFLLLFIPFVGTIASIYLLFFPGTNGENRYGSQPLQRINIKQDMFRI